MTIKKIKFFKSFKSLTKKQIIIICSITAAVVLIVVGFIIWQLRDNYDDSLGIAYVTPVSECNTVSGGIAENSYSGVVESQKAFEVKADSDKTIKEIKVKEGDEVNEGDELFTYDVEAMNLELEEGKIEIERMNNEIESNKSQIKELEAEKKSAGSDAQVSYTTQIQALETENDKTEYDIKVKKVALEKLENSIKNSSVKAEISGTVKNLKSDGQASSPDGDMTGSDVLMTIVTNSSFRIKGKINEQNIGAIMQGDSVIINSRVDDEVSWSGSVTEISNEPETNNNDMYYMGGDSESSSSNYAFYVEPENIDGLKLGQHVLIAIDHGQSSAIEKSGIWLYDDYLVADGESYFVWAAGKDDRLEKRYVEIGQKDEQNLDSEILSGLEESDLIAYPSDDYQEGMKVTTNIDDMINDDMNGDGENLNDVDIIPEGDIDGEFGDGEVIPEGGIDGEFGNGEIIPEGDIDGEFGNDEISPEEYGDDLDAAFNEKAVVE